MIAAKSDGGLVGKGQVVRLFAGGVLWVIVGRGGDLLLGKGWGGLGDELAQLGNLLDGFLVEGS